MKTAAALTAIVLSLGAATQADARPRRVSDYPVTVVVTGRDECGRPIYMERFALYINGHGHAMWGYRPVRSNDYSNRDRGYDRGRDDCEPSRGDRYDRYDDDRRDGRGDGQRRVSHYDPYGH